ncbi:MAG: SCO family protein [Roseiflexaceae bacterium]
MATFTRSWRFVVVLALVLPMLAACGPYTWRSGAQLDPANAAPNVVLTDQRGVSFQLDQQRGKVTLLFFGFTNCPDVCPTALADMAAVRRKLGSDADKTQVVFITVDPERDTPEVMGRYVGMFDPSYIALTGSPSELQAIYQAYGVTAIRRELPNSALKYTMDHSASVYVIDQAGRWRGLISHGAAIDDVVSDLQYLIRTGGA